MTTKSPEAAIAEIAAKYDGEAEALRAAALRRLAWRTRRGGKECSRCHETKPVGSFSSDSRRPDGLAYACLSCEARRKREARRPKPPTPPRTTNEQDPAHAHPCQH